MRLPEDSGAQMQARHPPVAGSLHPEAHWGRGPMLQMWEPGGGARVRGVEAAGLGVSLLRDRAHRPAQEPGPTPR